MILVRETFIARPGMASKLAKTIRDAQRESGGTAKVKVMTDLTGAFNKVVMETELGSLADLEKRMQEYGANTKLREKMSGYTDMYLTGEREVYQVLE
jgi:hypothetical protein